MSIEIRGLSKAFGDKQVLKDFSCTLEEGTTTCIMGPSGIGKTTLFSILLGLQKPDAGDTGKLPSLRLSAVFQEDRLCENLSAVGNTRLITGKSIEKKQITQALAAVGLEGESVRQPVRELSSGMCRRVALVRALLAPYEVLLLDEPLKGLDEDTKKQTLSYLKACTTKKTVLMITHDPEEAAAMGGNVIHLSGPSSPSCEIENGE